MSTPFFWEFTYSEEVVYDAKLFERTKEAWNLFKTGNPFLAVLVLNNILTSSRFD